MKRFIFLFLFSVFAVTFAIAQPIFQTTSSTISFHAGTPVEDIDAVNTKSLSFLNSKSGEVSISIPVKDFHFKRPLMEEHFNENYLESGKYPKAEFKGKINDVEKIDFASGQKIEITVTGMLTVHGVSKERTLNVTLQSSDSKIQGETKFDVALIDHKIDRPKILFTKIAETVNVTALFTYEPYKK
ncbi:hypothetical protein BH09BAC3_BH09BAC3_20390 [soil metagenome]